MHPAEWGFHVGHSWMTTSQLIHGKECYCRLHMTRETTEIVSNKEAVNQGKIQIYMVFKLRRLYHNISYLLGCHPLPFLVSFLTDSVLGATFRLWNNYSATALGKDIGLDPKTVVEARDLCKVLKL
ncbi:hypothetical protein V6N13_102606 [Hibiscus sabdariffa]